MFSNITDKIRLLFIKDKEPYLCFYKILGFYPGNIELYKQALLHKSSSIKEKGRLLNNERLEFLGDAILDAVVADIVYKKFDGKKEGFLTNTRSKIVQRDTLNQVAVKIGLDKLIKFTTRQSSHNSYMCGNAFEALVGAIYLDKGYQACMDFMEKRIIEKYLNLDRVSRKEVNFKSKLIEWSQKNKFEIEFILKAQSVDDDQNPTFETQVNVENIPGGIGSGYSKKESQQEAAHETLRMIKSDSQFIDLIYIAKQEREKATGDEAKVDSVTDNQITTENAEPTTDTVEEIPHEGENSQTENSEIEQAKAEISTESEKQTTEEETEKA